MPSLPSNSSAVPMLAAGLRKSGDGYSCLDGSGWLLPGLTAVDGEFVGMGANAPYHTPGHKTFRYFAVTQGVAGILPCRGGPRLSVTNGEQWWVVEPDGTVFYAGTPLEYDAE